MTRQEALDKLSAVGLALEEAKCSEWRLVHEVMQWIEQLSVAVPAGDLYLADDTEGTVGREEW